MEKESLLFLAQADRVAASLKSIYPFSINCLKKALIIAFIYFVFYFQGDEIKKHTFLLSAYLKKIGATPKFKFSFVLLQLLL